MVRNGSVLRTTEGRFTLDNVYITGGVAAGAGLNWYEPYETEAKGSLIVYNSINNDVDSKGQINKGNSALFKLGRGVWFNSTATDWTGYGGAINNTREHAIYINGQSDNISIYLSRAYQSTNERRYGYCFNGNSAGGLINGSAQQALDYTEIVDCFGEDAGYFADFSGSNNDRANDSWFQDVRMSGNYARIPDSFTYYNNCSNMTLFDNTVYQDGLKNQLNGLIVSAGDLSDTVTDNDLVVWDHDNDIFAACNRVINKFFSDINNNYDGSSYFEFIENEVYEDDNLLTYLDRGRASDYDASHAYLDNSFYTLNSKPFLDKVSSTSKTYTEYSGLITTAAGEWTGNNEIIPDWQDVSKCKFLNSRALYYSTNY